MPATTPKTVRASSKAPSSTGIKKPTQKKSIRNLRAANVDDIPDLPTKPQTQSSRTLTFGVEIEGVLAFHESLLQDVLDRYLGGVPHIAKDLSRATRWDLNNSRPTTTATQPMFDHVQWAVRYPKRNGGFHPHKGGVSFYDPDVQFNTHKYQAEQLVIAKEILAKDNLDVDVVATTRHKSKRIPMGKTGPAASIQMLAPESDYSKWTLSYDDTLFGLTGPQLYDLVGDSIAGANQSPKKKGAKISTLPKDRSWDSAGFELITPVFDYAEKDKAYKDIGKYLTSLKTGPKHRATTTVWGALQVHVGFSDGKEALIPEDVYRHLAFILMSHEDLLPRLHPRRRCGLPLKQKPGAARPPKSGADYTRNDPVNDQSQHDAEGMYTSCWQVNSHLRWFRHKHDKESPGWDDQIYTLIMGIFFEELTFRGVIRNMQKDREIHEFDPQRTPAFAFYRGFRYNFDNLRAMDGGSTWKTPKPTVEFRQHASSLCPVEIGKWVDLCCALVRYAERIAADTARWRQDPKLPSTYPQGRLRAHALPARDWQAILHAYPSLDDGKWPAICIHRFLGPEMLNLDADGRQYWAARYNKYKDEYPTADEIVETSASHFREFGHRAL